jgi:hypothetical protein
MSCKTMVIRGRVHNGVVVFDTPNALPEGTAVTVTLRNTPVIHVSPVRQRVQLPLVKSDHPGTLELTNERAAEIFHEEEIEAMKRTWNVTS